jgi:branched-chain amino acid aminotransferase
MNECYGKNYVLNGEVQPCEMFDNSLVYEGDSIYEVIRMMKGSPVFFNDHMERLSTSARLQKRKMLADFATLRKAVIILTRAEKKKESNIKIVFNYNNGASNWLVYFIEPIYPTREHYRKGVKGILYFAERKDPEAKVINHRLRSSVYHKLIHEGAYEALLVNEENQITEGSRTNIFFIKGETLYTAPDQVVLSGITRKHIIEICRENYIAIELTSVNADKIPEYDGVFMTGTSPMVLPFYCIDDVYFEVGHPIIERLRNIYVSKVEESIIQFRHE